MEIRNNILDAAESLLLHPLPGQKEASLEYFGLGHPLITESHYKIIYRVVGDYIYIPDVFDAR